MFARDHNHAVKSILTCSHVTTVCTQNNKESVQNEWESRSTYSDKRADTTETKLRYRRGTARRAMSSDILSSVPQLYENSHLKSLPAGE